MLSYTSALQMNNFGLMFLGAVLGVVVRFILTKTAEILRALFARDQTFRVLLGTWYTYHYTTEEGTTILREEEWRITWRPWSGVRVATHDPLRPTLLYKGKILMHPDLVCNMEGVGFAETYHMRLVPPIPRLSNTMWGLKVGVDFDRKIFAAIYLFTPKRIDATMAAKQLHDQVTPSIRRECLNLEVGQLSQRT